MSNLVGLTDGSEELGGRPELDELPALCPCKEDEDNEDDLAWAGL
jgi:hypothetical protein